MALTAGEGSDGWQVLTTTAEQFFLASATVRAARKMYIFADETNSDIALVNIPAIHGTKYVPVPKGACLPFEAPRGETGGGGITVGYLKMASGTGNIGWGVASA